MKLIRNYFSYNRLMRSLIKLPIVFLIWTAHTTLIYGTNHIGLKFSLFLTVAYVLFTINLKEGIKKFIARGADFRSVLTFYPLIGGILRQLLLLPMLGLLLHWIQDHNTWQKSFELALNMWATFITFAIMQDVERWLIYKYGQLKVE